MFPDLANLDRQVIGFTLVVFRVAGLMLAAPLFGSARVPRRFKVMIALVIALSIAMGPALAPIALPNSIGQLTVGLAGEICFGLVLGQVVSLVFIAAQWAGEMVGQQVGLNIAEVLDPQMGGSSVVGDLYFMLATCAFLAMGGHRQLVLGVHASLTACPPLSVLFTADYLDLLVRFLTAATAFALRLAAPVFVTMVIVDVAMGCISKTMPQLNVMSAGMAVRGVIGILVLALGVRAVAGVLSDRLDEHVGAVVGWFGTTR